MTDTTAPAVTITERERRVMRAIVTNDFANGDPQADVWSLQINDATEPSGVTGRALSAVCSSLVQKGLARTSGSGREQCIRLTPAGAALVTG